MDLTSIRFDYTKSLTSPSVESPLHFLKLAIQDLNVPYVYLKRTLNLSVATGASFRVQNFDVESPEVSAYTGVPLERGQWLVSKHIPPPTPELIEELSVEGGSFDATRLAEISLELRVLGHRAIRNHDNIVDLLGFSWEKKPDVFGRRWPILVMENANYGSLAHFFQNADPHLRTLDVALSLAADISAGLVALHDCGVIHGDLKPQNVLVFEDKDGSVRAKISDFGSAIIMSDHVVSEDEEPSILPPASTQPWEAPEAYQPIPLTLLPKIDVYAFGLLFCYLISLGTSAFESISSTDDSTDTPQKYDFDAITALKTRDRSMIDHSIRFIARTCKIDGDIAHHAAHVIEATLNSRATERLDMTEVLRIITGQEESDDIEPDLDLVPPFLDDDTSSDELPEYQDLGRWDRDLMRAASPDIITSWRQRILADACSGQPDRVERAGRNLFWLSRWALSKVLGDVPTADSLSWLLEAADMGSIEARAVVYNIHTALGETIPSQYESFLEEWLTDACEKDELPAESVLKELYPDRYQSAILSLRTIYCGYGQDCFGERWRNEYPLDVFEDWLEEFIQDDGDLNRLHEYPGLVCDMTWLHYAASSGNLDMVRYLVDRGADPNVVNGYGETALFMACQAGHFEVVQLICPKTCYGTQEYAVFTELHFIDKFEQPQMDTMVEMLVRWGLDINNPMGENGQTPMAHILNGNSSKSVYAMRSLLKFGADPAVKDDNGLDCLAQAACNLSLEQMRSLHDFYPPENQAESRAAALWFLMEMDECELLVRGGGRLDEKLEATLGFLADEQSRAGFEKATHHPVPVFASAKAPLAVLRALTRLGPPADLDALVHSAREWHSPLLAAVVEDRADVVAYLLRRGADPTVALPSTGWTPLFYAVTRSPAIAGLLVRAVEEEEDAAAAAGGSRQAAVDCVNHRDAGGATAFDVAVAGEFFDAADVLLEYRPDFLAFTMPCEPDGPVLQNMLAHVCYMADPLFYLLRHVGDKEGLLEVDDSGVTIIHSACGVPIDRAPEVEARAILDAVLTAWPSPAYANCRSKDADTPLHYASRFGNHYALQRLDAMYGSSLDWHAVNSKGWTALDEAEVREFHDISELSYIEKARYRARTESVVAYLVEKGVQRKRTELLN